MELAGGGIAQNDAWSCAVVDDSIADTAKVILNALALRRRDLGERGQRPAVGTGEPSQRATPNSRSKSFQRLAVILVHSPMPLLTRLRTIRDVTATVAFL